MAKIFIGELAAQLGLNPRTLRYYENLDLLPAPSRTMRGYRVYGEETAQRLTFITKAKSLGLALKEIGQTLALRDSGELPCSSVQRRSLSAAAPATLDGKNPPGNFSKHLLTLD